MKRVKHEQPDETMKHANHDKPDETMKRAYHDKLDETMKRAYHDICLPDGTLQQGPVVVETDSEGRLLDWHKLQGEEPFTEWVGGTFRMSECNLTS